MAGKKPDPIPPETLAELYGDDHRHLAWQQGISLFCLCGAAWLFWGKALWWPCVLYLVGHLVHLVLSWRLLVTKVDSEAVTTCVMASICGLCALSAEQAAALIAPVGMGALVMGVVVNVAVGVSVFMASLAWVRVNQDADRVTDPQDKGGSDVADA